MDVFGWQRNTDSDGDASVASSTPTSAAHATAAALAAGRQGTPRGRYFSWRQGRDVDGFVLDTRSFRAADPHSTATPAAAPQAPAQAAGALPSPSSASTSASVSSQVASECASAPVHVLGEAQWHAFEAWLGRGEPCNAGADVRAAHAPLAAWRIVSSPVMISATFGKRQACALPLGFRYSRESARVARF